MLTELTRLVGSPVPYLLDRSVVQYWADFSLIFRLRKQNITQIQLLNQGQDQYKDISQVPSHAKRDFLVISNTLNNIIKIEENTAEQMVNINGKAK